MRGSEKLLEFIVAHEILQLKSTTLSCPFHYFEQLRIIVRSNLGKSIRPINHFFLKTQISKLNYSLDRLSIHMKISCIYFYGEFSLLEHISIWTPRSEPWRCPLIMNPTRAVGRLHNLHTSLVHNLWHLWVVRGKELLVLSWSWSQFPTQRSWTPKDEISACPMINTSCWLHQKITPSPSREAGDQS